MTGKEYKARCEFIAPLDCMMWDRKLIKALFGFYVLPILYGEKLVGRVEAVADAKTKMLVVKNVWFEDGVKQTKKLVNEIDRCMKRFAKFNECENHFIPFIY